MTGSPPSSPAPTHDAADADLVVLATVWDAAVRHRRGARRPARRQGRDLHGERARRRAAQFVPVLTAARLDRRRGADGGARAPRSSPRSTSCLRPRSPTSATRSSATCSSSATTTDGPTVLDLIDGIPELRAFDAGSLANAVGIEAFSAALLTVNLRHKGKGTLRLEGIGPAP